jgi:hypothetical protein
MAYGQLRANPLLEEADARELIGGLVLSKDGDEVGQIAAVSLKPDGEISEVRITTSASLGFGERTVIVPPGRYMALRGTLILELSFAEMQQLAKAPADGAL